MEIMIVFISFYNYKNNLLYLIFYGYCYGIFHICHKNWKIRENDSIVLCLKLTGHKKKMNPHITNNSAIHN